MNKFFFINVLLCAISLPGAFSASTKCKSFYLSMSDIVLFSFGITNKIPGCRISFHEGISSTFCDMYVKVGDEGFPLNRFGRGTGCVRAPDFPKRMSICWYSRSVNTPFNANARPIVLHERRDEECSRYAASGYQHRQV